MKKWNYWLLPICWMGIIFYSSSQPYQDQNIKPLLSNFVDLDFLIPVLDGIVFTYHHSEISIKSLGVYGFIEFFIRKGAHMVVFFVLLLCFYTALKKTSDFQVIKRVIISLFLTVAYAGIDELHQGFTQNRTPYAGDVVMDTSGALLAISLIYLVCLVKNKKAPEKDVKF
ncbi:VanZ family protein [Sediminibacillus dalangtanensis]|uniref:VanZ family protein n=1 Tax=Sediminibacillus dalangtanensis TaxID=2729421 RepID=UPI001FD73336|nr:VanZ family protein [Sediminibacillus dalangtanensis]